MNLQVKQVVIPNCRKNIQFTDSILNYFHFCIAGLFLGFLSYSIIRIFCQIVDIHHTSKVIFGCFVVGVTNSSPRSTPGEAKPIFEAESPDELALVETAYCYNCRLTKRTPTSAAVSLPGGNR